MKKILILFLFTISNNYLIYSQPSILWQKCLGGSDSETAYSIQETNDGGLIVAGSSGSNDGDVTGNHGGFDYWIVKLDSARNIQWQKSLGGTLSEQARAIQQTTDGGYIVAGYSQSSDGDVSGNHGSFDYWVVKLNSIGIIQWQNNLGGTGDEHAYSIQQTTDGGYVVAGYAGANNGDVSGNHGSFDFWIVKIDSGGANQWQKCLGGTGDERANFIQQTNDGGFIVAGYTNSNDGDVSGNHGTPLSGFYDYWIVKLDFSGTILWQKCFGGTGDEHAFSIQQTNEGGYILAGYSMFSNNGDVSGNHNPNLPDYWIVKTDSIGTIQWQKCLGGTHIEDARSILQTIDGGYLIAGTSHSVDGDVTGNQGYDDYWIVKLNNAGILQWQKSFGGNGNDNAYEIRQAIDGGIVVAGETQSSNGDVTGIHNNSSDFWIIKLSATIGMNKIQNSKFYFQIFPNPFSNQTIISYIFPQSINNSIKIYDIEGRKIKKFASENLNIFTNELVWDATNNFGDKVEAGIYFITIISNNISETKKVVLTN